MEKHWTGDNQLLFLPSTNTTAYNRTFKYGVGDTFVDTETGDKFEITGFNYTTGTYQGNIIMQFGSKTKIVKTNLIFESKLEKMAMFVGGVKSTLSKKKDGLINYRIYYFEEGHNKSIQKDIQLTNIRALAKYLNSLVKVNSKRRIIMVCILDDNGVYVEQVKFLKQEFKEQKFLTGMKERLLAYAKYECGYEVATSF